MICRYNGSKLKKVIIKILKDTHTTYYIVFGYHLLHSFISQKKAINDSTGLILSMFILPCQGLIV